MLAAAGWLAVPDVRRVRRGDPQAAADGAPALDGELGAPDPGAAETRFERALEERRRSHRG
jgi:hypothetical protein